MGSAERRSTATGSPAGQRLEPGGGVAVVAPAGPASEAAYRAGLAILGARYRLVRTYEPAASCEPAADAPYLAADDATRAEWMNAAIADPEVCAIFCARGGYGCARIVDRLDSATFARRRIPLVGFSDVTVLHSWAATLEVPTIHGPVVTQLPRLPARQLDALYTLLERDEPTPLTQLSTIRAGTAKGTLWGGNLTLITHLLGTPHLAPLRGRIVLLEDVGEAPYRIDRMCTQLLQSGALDHIAGIVLGQFVDCNAPEPPGTPPSVTAEQVLADRLGRLDVPIVSGAPVGHETENMALPLGRTAELDAAAGTLSFPAV